MEQIHPPAALHQILPEGLEFGVLRQPPPALLHLAQVSPLECVAESHPAPDREEAARAHLEQCLEALVRQALRDGPAEALGDREHAVPGVDRAGWRLDDRAGHCPYGVGIRRRGRGVLPALVRQQVRKYDVRVAGGVVHERREAHDERGAFEHRAPCVRIRRRGERIRVVQEQRLDRVGGGARHVSREPPRGAGGSEPCPARGEGRARETGAADSIHDRGDERIERRVGADLYPPRAIDASGEHVERVHRHPREQSVRRLHHVRPADRDGRGAARERAGHGRNPLHRDARDARDLLGPVVAHHERPEAFPAVAVFVVEILEP